MRLNFDEVWGRYEKGKEVLRQKKEKEEKKAAVIDFEISVFGKKLTAYLMQDRGVQQGPDMGKVIGKIKGIMAKNSNLPPEELKKLIDGTEL